MKLLITGDVHGLEQLLIDVISANLDVDLKLNTGDLQISDNFVRENGLIAVRGNCDFYTEFNDEEIIVYDNRKILLVHGHLFNVKYSINELVSYAKSKSVDICIFGHTHIPYEKIIDGIHFINPGALNHFKPTYAIYDNGKVTFKTI